MASPNPARGWISGARDRRGRTARTPAPNARGDTRPVIGNDGNGDLPVARLSTGSVSGTGASAPILAATTQAAAPNDAPHKATRPPIRRGFRRSRSRKFSSHHRAAMTACGLVCARRARTPICFTTGAKDTSRSGGCNARLAASVTIRARSDVMLAACAF